MRFDNVGMRYGRGPEILRDLSFDLPRGSFQFLTGPSGAGKTSLLRLIYLAAKPSRGLISYFGRDAATLPRNELPDLRRRVGVVFQEFRLLAHMNVFDNVALPLRVAGRKRQDYAEDVAELLAWVGLGEKMNALPATLSGGEQQRVAIARAVVGQPEVLIADEPTGNVDPEMGMRLLRLFAELNKLGTTIIIATHDLQLVRMLDAPVMTLSNGHLHIRPPRSERRRMKEAAEAAEAEADAEAERIAAAPAAAAPRQPDLDEPRAADANHTPDRAGEDDD
ncbi:cell division ATP-binding protein FtsE [Maricaulis sp.]|uniref:cell division ATP-binding protein FtsE n=1 Tax=Maricaulis sp. TaxID=1486257 RepID=UPI00260F997E|nr:cell division ATP-binding protein FtsE [Maricaulis sp.]MDF1769505.1 cell division ATP-binding protein FtsE [Maricaulis sp.]